MKLVDDVTGEEVSEMHARSVLVGTLDPVIRQNTAMNHCHMRPSRRSCRSSPTSRRRARKQCRLNDLKQAPLRRRQTGRRQWQTRPRTAGKNMVLSTRHGFTTVLDLQRIRSRIPELSQRQKQGNFGKSKGAYE